MMWCGGVVSMGFGGVKKAGGKFQLAQVLLDCIGPKLVNPP